MLHPPSATKPKKQANKTPTSKVAERQGDQRDEKKRLSLVQQQAALQDLLTEDTLSHSHADGEGEVTLLTLPKLMFYGKRYKDIPLGAACELCSTKDDGPADLPNYHTLFKHLTGKPHKKKLREALIAVSKQLASESSDSTHATPTRRDLAGRGGSSSRSSSSSNSSSGTRTPRYQYFRFTCINLECEAEASATVGDTKAKCSSCGMLQAVRTPRS